MPAFRAAANEQTADRRAAEAGSPPPSRAGHPLPDRGGPPRQVRAAEPWTPPHQRGSAPHTEGPTEPLRPAPPREPAPRRKGRVGVAIAVLLGLLALLASAAAGYLAWRAMEVAQAGHAMPAAAPRAAPAREPEPEDYPVSYAKEPLRVQVGCSAALFLDLDEPRADSLERDADLRYDSRCGDEPPRISLGAGAAAGSAQAGADTDAAGCRRAIRTSPLGPGADVEVRKGTALCVLTAGDPAGLVLVEIIDVGGTGTAGLRATSWQVPR